MAEYRNPQTDSGLDFSRMLPSLIIFFLLLLGIQYFIPHKQTPPQQQQTQQQQQQTQQQTPSSPAAAPIAAVAAPSAPTAPVQQSASESVTIVENELYRITFTNRGALVKSWILKKYKGIDGKPLDLVQQQASEEYGYPLSLWSADKNLKDNLNSGLYLASATGQVMAPASLVFTYSDGDIVVEKKFSFDASYKIRIDSSVRRGSSYLTALPAWPAGFGDTSPSSSNGASLMGVGRSIYNRQTIDLHNGNKLQRMTADSKGEKVGNNHLLGGPIVWGGTVDQYFAAIFMPDTPQQASLAQMRNSITPKTVPGQKDTPRPVEYLGAAVGEQNAPVHISVYVGPKVLSILDSTHANSADGQPGAGPNLQGAVDLGMFSFFARPLFDVLNWLEQRVTSNWGWAIALLTLLINVVLFPLRYKQMRSALEMQKIAPMLKNLQEKYKKYKFNDPRRQEQAAEQQALYKEHGVHPMAGCLPALVQLPFFWAFYQMLGNSIELRQTSWLWIPDLSAPDPWHLLPVLVGVVMLVLQHMTPMGAISDDQRRMMNIMMPVMMLMIFWNLAGGLSIYMVTSNVVSLSQQYIMNRTKLGREIRAVQAKQAAKRKKR